MESTDYFFSISHSGYKKMSETFNLMLQGAERLREHQMRAIQDALVYQAEHAKGLESASSLEQLQTMRANFMRDMTDKATAYWTGVFNLTRENQMALLKKEQTDALEMAEGVRQTMAVVPQGAEPIASALKAVVDTACSTYAAGVRAPGEPVRLQTRSGRSMPRPPGEARRASDRVAAKDYGKEPGKESGKEQRPRGPAQASG